MVANFAVRVPVSHIKIYAPQAVRRAVWHAVFCVSVFVMMLRRKILQLPRAIRARYAKIRTRARMDSVGSRFTAQQRAPQDRLCARIKFAPRVKDARSRRVPKDNARSCRTLF